MTTRDLAKKWNRLEPERFRPNFPGWSVPLGRAPLPLLYKDFTRGELSAHDQALLLAAVTEAIEAREWDWALTSYVESATGERKYMATVAYQVEKASTSLAALLTAYLAALEAVAGQ